MKKTEYECWKEGKRTFKAPWVIKHYQSITDINQYRLGKKAQDISITLITIISFICGLWMGNILWS